MDEVPVATTRPTLASRLGFIALGAVLLFGVIVYSTAQFGFVRGEEFSPRSFQRREFWYYEIPLVGIQVSPIEHNDTTGLLEEHLVQQKLLPGVPSPTERWDLIMATRGQSLASVGGAQILSNYLKAMDAEDELVWLDWTKDHVEAAKFLWPVVARLAEQELYIFVPELLSIALETNNAKKLEKRARHALGRWYFETAQNRQKLARHEQAIELFTESLVHVPNQAVVFEQRAKSHVQLGNDQRATADLAEARRLRSELR